MVPENICELVVVRHGQTESNRTGTLQGQLDTALDKLGILQAQAVAGRLKKRQFDKVYSSDLGRAVDTAKTILQYHPELELNTTPALREWDLGDLQGRLLKDLAEKEPEIMNAFRTEMPDLQIPGGESLKEFQHRVSTFIDSLAKENCGRRLLLVSHGGAIQRMLRHTTGKINAPNVRPFCSNASIAVFRCKNAENWQLVTWNDTAHLEELEQNDLLPL